MTYHESWVLNLNTYQRDNLLWLLNAVGYPHVEGPNGLTPIQPFNFANTGDWVGEIALQLARPRKSALLTTEDNPNKSLYQLRDDVAAWLEQQCET